MDAISPASLDAYDAAPYLVSAFPQTDPDRLAVVARLFGVRTAPPPSCRVLELGCASGGNIIPLALAYPGSQFTGVDLSRRQIEDGQAVARNLGMENLTLLHMSICDITPGLGQFDYIVAHGVYSWVLPAVQEKILQCCRANLAPTGIAYISYNTLPGWHVKGALRELLLYHTRGIVSPVDRLRMAREQLERHEKLFGQSSTAFSAMMVREIAALQKDPDAYLLHDYMEDCNEPVHFHEFVRRAREQGLEYLAESEVATMFPARFGAAMEKALRDNSPDPIALEQEMDFLRNRAFRQTLLCHREVAIDRKPDVAAVAEFHVASAMKPESADVELFSDKKETFSGTDSPKLTTPSPVLKAAFVILARRCPLPTPFVELLAEVRAVLKRGGGGADKDAAELAEGCLNCYTASIVDFTLTPPRFTTTVSPRPMSSAYIRFRAGAGREVTSQRLENIVLTEPARVVLSHLDGRHDRESLVELVARSLEGRLGAEAAPAQASRYIDYILPNFARSGLLIA